MNLAYWQCEPPEKRHGAFLPTSVFLILCVVCLLQAAAWLVAWAASLGLGAMGAQSNSPKEPTQLLQPGMAAGVHG